MKTLALVLLLAFGATAQAQQSSEVMIDLTDVLIPSGVSERGGAYIVVAGYFPNSCYSWDRAEVTNRTPRLHEIRVYAWKTGQLCRMERVTIPYQATIELGRLAEGEQRLRFENADGTSFERTFDVEP